MTKRVYKALAKPHRTFHPAEPSKKAWYKPDDDAKTKLRSSDRWKRLRDSVFSEQPLCFVCGVIADDIHHIDMTPDLFFVRENLVAMCEKCHKKTHEAYRRGIPADIIFASRGR